MRVDEAWKLINFFVFIALLATPAHAGSTMYKCARPDGSSSFSDTPCGSNAERVDAQTTAPSGLNIRSAAYASARMRQGLDVTQQLSSLCARAPGSCLVSCSNQLAGDPDFGQRKSCQIVYACGGGKARELRMNEGERVTLDCSVNSASPSVAGDNASAAVNQPLEPPGSVAELANTLQSFGRATQGFSFDMLTVVQMRLLAPDKPELSRSNPLWLPLFATVRQDLGRDLERPFQAWMTESAQGLAGALAAHVTPSDVGQLLAFYRSAEGRRYIAFQHRLDAIAAQGITQADGPQTGAGAPPSSTDPAPHERLEARRRVLACSWAFMTATYRMATVQIPDTHHSGGKVFVGARTVDVVAIDYGRELDALEQRYAADLTQFEAFNQSPAAKSLLAATQVALQQATAHSPESVETALNNSAAMHRPSWQAMYEAGGGNTVNARAQIEQRDRPTSLKTQDQLAPTASRGCIGLEKVKASVTPPELYDASRECVDQGDYEAAARLFFLAGAYGRFDVARVGDKAAGQALTTLITAFGNGLRADQKQAFTAATAKFRSAKDREPLCAQFKRLGPPNYFPQYLAGHAIKATTTPDSTGDPFGHNFNATAAWQRILQEGLTCSE